MNEQTFKHLSDYLEARLEAKRDKTISRRHTNERNVKLFVSPHWSYDREYSEAKSVFGREAQGLGYDYSDRLQQWDYEKSRAAFAVANESDHVKNSADYYELYLTEYFGKPISLEHMLAGYNVSNGYPYIVFGYRVLED